MVICLSTRGRLGHIIAGKWLVREFFATIRQGYGLAVCRRLKWEATLCQKEKLVVGQRLQHSEVTDGRGSMALFSLGRWQLYG
jgi:hypothetical protein